MAKNQSSTHKQQLIEKLVNLLAASSERTAELTYKVAVSIAKAAQKSDKNK